MQYLVEVNESDEYLIELDESDRGTWQVDLEDGTHAVLQLKGQDAEGRMVVLVDGVEHRFTPQRIGEELYLNEGGHAARVDVRRAADVVIDHNAVREAPAPPDADALESPITGIVLEVMVAPGDRIEPGAPLVVIEAMKMENTLTAPVAAEVTEVSCERGQTVFVDDLLMRFAL